MTTLTFYLTIHRGCFIAALALFVLAAALSGGAALAWAAGAWLLALFMATADRLANAERLRGEMRKSANGAHNFHDIDVGESVTFTHPTDGVIVGRIKAIRLLGDQLFYEVEADGLTYGRPASECFRFDQRNWVVLPARNE